MLLLCPGCQNLVEAERGVEGKVRCPRCQHQFAAPSPYEPEVLSPSGSGWGSGTASAAIIPPPVPSTTTTSSTIGTTPGTTVTVPPLPELPQDYTRMVTLTLSPNMLVWLPPLFLTCALLSTFFPWVGMYMGDAMVYSQGPWRALVGSVSANPHLADALRWPTNWLDQLRSDWLLVLPALLLLMIAFVIAWADRGLTEVDVRRIPPLARLWPRRRVILLGVIGVATLLLLVQSWYGLSMERALHAAVEQRFAEELQQAESQSVQRLLVTYRIEQELQRYNLAHTLWQRLGLISLCLALLSMSAQLLLEYRGEKPPPRVVIQW